MSNQNLKKLLAALLTDLRQLPRPDTIFITGDIAYSGQVEEYEIYKKDFVLPLIDALGLGLESVIVTPGNHDTNRAAWTKTDLLMRDQLIRNYDHEPVKNILIEKIDTQHCDWFSGFVKFRDEIDSCKTNTNKRVFANKFFATYDVDGIGIGCLNSAWLSYEKDQHNLVIGAWQLQEVIQSLKPFEQIILLLHHPFNWLHDLDRRMATEVIHTSGVKSMFYGHMHEFSMIKESQFSENSLLSIQTGKFDISQRDNNTGYILLSLHDKNNFESGELYFRKFDAQRETFLPWTERVANGTLRFSLIDSIPFNDSDFAAACQDLIDKLECDLLCNVGLPSDQQKKLSEIFVCPSLVTENETTITNGLSTSSTGKDKLNNKISLDTISSMNESLIILGGENSGKSTLAKRLTINFLREQASKNFENIVFFLDAKKSSFSKPKKLREYLLNFYTDEADTRSFQAKIERKLDDSSSIVIIDSIESLDTHGLKVLFEFIESHTKARFILCGQLSIRQALFNFTTPLYDKKRFRFLTVKGFNRSHIRELVGKWAEPGDGKVQSTIKQALKVVSGAGMPNNPFVYTMLLSIRQRKETAFRTFMHEADLVENFIEIIMQKHLFSSENTPQYKDILLFLGYVALKMHENSDYTMSETVLIKTVAEFNEQITQDFKYDSYIRPIIISGIIRNDEGKYKFTQICFFNYVFANWIAKQDFTYPELNSRLDFLRFDKVVEYVSAIKKSDLSLLDYVSNKTEEAWRSLLDESQLTDLKDMESEMTRCVKHDLLDLIKEESLASDFVDNHNGTEKDLDEVLDKASPLNDAPVSEIKSQRENILPAAKFHEMLSLYARVFRAAEHIMNAEITMLHFSKIYGYCMNSIAYNVRYFDNTLRPILLQKLFHILNYDSMDKVQKQQTLAQLNAVINFTIAAIPNWTVSMMNSDFFNQRQKPRMEKYRNSMEINLGKILLTYCLCELDGVDIISEIKDQKYDRPHESTSLVIKIIELISFNFSLSKEDKKALEQFAKKVLKDRKTQQLLTNLSIISNKLTTIQ